MKGINKLVTQNPAYRKHNQLTLGELISNDRRAGVSSVASHGGTGWLIGATVGWGQQLRGIRTGNIKNQF